MLYRLFITLLTVTSVFACDDGYDGTQESPTTNAAIYEPEAIDNFLLSVLRQAGLPEEDLYENGGDEYLFLPHTPYVLAAGLYPHPLLYWYWPVTIYRLQLLWYMNLICRLR